MVNTDVQLLNAFVRFGDVNTTKWKLVFGTLLFVPCTSMFVPERVILVMVAFVVGPGATFEVTLKMPLTFNWFVTHERPTPGFAKSRVKNVG